MLIGFSGVDYNNTNLPSTLLTSELIVRLNQLYHFLHLHCLFEKFQVTCLSMTAEMKICQVISPDNIHHFFPCRVRNGLQLRFCMMGPAVECFFQSALHFLKFLFETQIGLLTAVYTDKKNVKGPRRWSRCGQMAVGGPLRNRSPGLRSTPQHLLTKSHRQMV